MSKRDKHGNLYPDGDVGYITNSDPSNYSNPDLWGRVKRANEATGLQLEVRDHPMPEYHSGYPNYDPKAPHMQKYKSIYSPHPPQDLGEWWAAFDLHDAGVEGSYANAQAKGEL